MNHYNKKTVWMGICATLIITLFFAGVYALPGGPTITYIENSTRNTSAPTNRTADDGGYIVTMNLSLEQQTQYWKAYVGNVTGSITLDDSSSYTIYSWALASITGEVFATRASSVTWSNIECANSSSISSEDTTLNMSGSPVYSVTNTFNETNHTSFLVSGRNMSSCYYTATYINDTAQTVNSASNWQEVVLQSGSNIVYATILEQDAYNYKGVTNSTYDFQMIVGEDETESSPITYFFYVELG